MTESREWECQEEDIQLSLTSSQYSLRLLYRYLRHSMLLIAGGIIPWGGGGANRPFSKE